MRKDRQPPLKELPYPKDFIVSLLVEVVHALPMYPSHKAYARDLLHENLSLSPEDLSQALAIPLGEALVILHELEESKENP